MTIWFTVQLDDRPGALAQVAQALADRGVNITELTTHSRPGPGGSPHYALSIAAEVPLSQDVRTLREALEAVGDRLVIDVALLPA